METAPEPRQLTSGTMLDDKYRIERLLATGGMGAVYLGTHIKLRKRVAIKILNPALNNKLMIERFHREAITASQIGHEGIAQVTDLGTSSEGEPFLVMEYLEGESLAQRLKASGPLPVDVACELGCAILSPLGAAHQAGIVHRDLKPDNVFLVRQSRGEMVKLLDFGISRVQGLEGEFRLTTTGLVLGTPYYMSPEQARGNSEVGPAADLYAFGVMLYEMLVGQVPIHGENYNQLMYRVMTGEYAPPRNLRQDIPPLLEQVILRAMAIEAVHRQATAMDLEQELLAFCRPTFREHTIERLSSAALSFHMSSGSQVPARISGPGLPSPTGTDRTVLAAPTPPPRIAKRSKKKVWIGLAIAALLGGGAGALALALQDREKPSTVAQGAGTDQSGAADKAGGDKAAASDQAGGPDKSGASGGDKAEAGGPDKAGASGADKAGAPDKSGGPEAAAPDKAGTSGGPEAGAPDKSGAPDKAATVPTITLRFAIEPATAKIAIDNKPVTGTEQVVTKDGATHRLKITAPGHVAHEEEIRFDESQRLTVQLKRVGGTRPPPKKPDKTGPKKPDRIDPESPY